MQCCAVVRFQRCSDRSIEIGGRDEGCVAKVHGQGVRVDRAFGHAEALSRVPSKKSVRLLDKLNKLNQHALDANLSFESEM